MRKQLFITTLFYVVFAPHAQAGIEACVQQKFNAMKQVTEANVGTMFKQHFDQKALVITANGGQAAWKRLSEEKKKAATAKLSDQQRLKKLAAGFGAYKSATITKTTINGLRAILIVKTHKGNKVVTIHFNGSCKITQICVEKSGCAHQLF